MNIHGSFSDVMDFQKILSCITGNNQLALSEDTDYNMISLKKDMGIIMESMHLLLANSLINLPENSLKHKKINEPEKISTTKKSGRPRKKNS